MTNEEFLKEISEGTVVVDFWAPWCGPCKAVTPVLDAIVAKHGVKLVKVNVDDEEELANAYNLNSIPTIMSFRDGQLDKTVIGAYALDAMEKRLGFA